MLTAITRRGWSVIAITTRCASTIAALRKLAEEGSASAQIKLGRELVSDKELHKGHQEVVDDIEAIEWWKKATPTSPIAYYYLGASAARGLGPYKERTTKERFKKCREYWEKGAKEGNARCQSSLALILLEGRPGVKKSNEEAIRWWTKAAEQQYVHAMVSLGQLHCRGIALPLSIEKARYWLEQAAQQEDVGAMMELFSLEKEQGNIEEAKRWCEQAGNHNHTAAHGHMGDMVFNEGDTVRAVEWWTKGANLGDPNVQVQLGLAYWKGVGVKVCEEKAMRWLFAAAGQGHAQGSTLLQSLMQTERGRKGMKILFQQEE